MAETKIGARKNENDSNRRRIRVLVVEDDEDCRVLLQDIMRRADFDYRAADSVELAMDLLVGFWPDAIVSDLGMPREDGYSFIRRVRELRMGRFIPAIALTAFGSEHVRRRALLTGFDRHMTKPAEPEELVLAIRDLVARAQD